MRTVLGLYNTVNTPTDKRIVARNGDVYCIQMDKVDEMVERLNERHSMTGKVDVDTFIPAGFPKPELNICGTLKNFSYRMVEDYMVEFSADYTPDVEDGHAPNAMFSIGTFTIGETGQRLNNPKDILTWYTAAK